MKICANFFFRSIYMNEQSVSNIYRFVMHKVIWLRTSHIFFFFFSFSVRLSIVDSWVNLFTCALLYISHFWFLFFSLLSLFTWKIINILKSDNLILLFEVCLFVCLLISSLVHRHQLMASRKRHENPLWNVCHLNVSVSAVLPEFP